MGSLRKKFNNDEKASITMRNWESCDKIHRNETMVSEALVELFTSQQEVDCSSCSWNSDHMLLQMFRQPESWRTTRSVALSLAG